MKNEDKIWHLPATEEMRRRKIVQKGIQFCVLLLGESGLGKNTFINNLSNKVIFEKELSEDDPEHAHLEPGFEIFSKQIFLRENNSTPINLDLVLTKGLGDNINNSDIPNQIKEYLDNQFELVLNEENRINRKTKLVDTRPHVCLYFIKATSRGLCEFDIILMKKICEKVNLLPIIAKGDLFTDEELLLNKQLILKDIKSFNIKIYQFNDDLLSDTFLSDFYVYQKNESLNKATTSMSLYSEDTRIEDMLPFSVVCSNDTVSDSEVDENTAVHVRKYDWGNIIIEDPQSSDFIFLKNIILGSHLQDLKDHTHNTLYENYRTKKLMQTEKTNNISFSNINLLELKEISKNSVALNIQNPTASSPVSMQNRVSSVKDSNESLVIALQEKEKLLLLYQKKVSELQNILQITTNR
ncbi:hypothetical protein QEN19_001978 [Hanseniaspora menglaensis]